MTVFLWWQTFQGIRQSELAARQLEAREGIAEIEEALRGVEQFGSALAQSVVPSQPQPDWEALSVQGKPFFRLYLWGFENVPSVEPVPEWMHSLVNSRSETGVASLFTPLPPGYAAGRIQLTQDTPERYLLFGVSWPQDRAAVWALDWDYLYGPWLDKKFNNLLNNAEVAWSLRTPGRGGEKTSGEVATGWSFELKPLVPESVSSLPSVVVQVSNEKFESELWGTHLRYLLGIIFVFFAAAGFLVLSLRTRNRELEYIRAKERFLSMVGHELRTPIATLEMYLEMLCEGLVEGEDKRQEYHQTLRRESHRLKCLVENLLAAGTAESGKLNLTRTEFCLRKLLDEVVGQENRDNREVNLEAPQEDCFITADREALYGVISNLLNNALKYSEASVDIALTTTAQRYRITVEDRGPGADDYEILFEPYFRGETKKKRGLGLGLALVRLLVEAHSGIISGKTRKGGGSVFVVDLPNA